MRKIKFLIFMSLIAVLAAYAPVAAYTPAPRLGLFNGVNEGPGGVPHYFGPFGNWAYSPLPRGPVTTVTVVEGGSGYSLNPTVTVVDAYITPTTLANVTANVVGGVITGFNIVSGGADYIAPVVIITDAGNPPGSGAIADATIGGTLTGGMRKFVDKMPGLGPNAANALGQFIPVAVPGIAPAPTPALPASDYYEIALVEFSEKMHSDLPNPTRLRGYVQIVPFGWTGTDIFGNNYSAVALTTTNGLTQNILIGGVPAYGASKPHHLGPLIVAMGSAHGVAGAAGQPKPVRIKFYNLLPAGAGGDLFLPVDETVTGSGLGPSVPSSTAGEKYTQNRATIHLHGNSTVWISDGNTHQWITPAGDTTHYPKGVSVRNVPDMGTACDIPHSGCLTFFYTNAQSARLQFYHDHAMGITRLNVYAGEAAGYVLTNQVETDMITGSNVSGVNPSGLKVLPGYGIPLVIQDRTWVDADTIFAQDPTWNWGTGPRTAGNITGAVTGDFWFPHVYMSAQKAVGGVNPYGRWHYGPWFNPPTPECVNGLPVGCIEVGPIPNEYFGTASWEPPTRPGVPNPSIPGEAFMDTPTVNGTAYPYIEVPASPVRFRVLSAANDRMFNLQLYVAADKTTPTTPGTTGTVLCDGTTAVPVANCTEVKMVPVSVAQANQFADWPSGIPDPLTKGPAWWQIGTEGGFLPKPVEVPQQPVGWNLDPTAFNFGVVNQHSLLLGSAERADVVVDFTNQQGKTFILYNDAPAAFPAGVPTYDYYTGVANQMDVGGAPMTQPGYGPNTRTIMQIRVGSPVSTPDVTLANLQAVFAKGDTTGCPNAPCKRGVFEVSQDPIILPQAAYNSAYNNTFPADDASQYFGVQDTAKTFQPINENGVLQPAVTLTLEKKAMHDEMGGVYDTQFGRMSGMLGLTNPKPGQAFLIPYGYAAPPTDLVKGSVEGQPIGVMPDGTQIWRIFHNGVDTHTIHTHLFHAQLIQRIGQDNNSLNPPDPEELGWKDTFRVNPLEVTFLAMRPTVPTPAQLPFEAPDSFRLIDPTLPEGATLIPPPPAGWFDPDGEAITEIANHYVNFGWEYVWHCHILAHEEMDMMHSLVFAVPPRPPALSTTYTVTGPANNPTVNLTFTDNSIKEARFTVQRATNANFTTGLTTFPVGAHAGVGNVGFPDTTVASNTAYWYRVFAIGATVGDTQTYPNSLGFPTMSADSVSNTIPVVVGAPTTTVPANPITLTTTVPTTGTPKPRVSLTWNDRATNETGFRVERCTGAGCTQVPPVGYAQIALPGPRNGTGNVTYQDTTVTPGNTYFYRVWAVNAIGDSAAPTNATSATVPAIPAAPTNFTVSAVKSNPNNPNSNYTATLNWNSPSGNPTDFTIERATNASFTTNRATFTPGGAARSLTQTINRNTTYYYRIRANSNISGSSAWKNALPFPIATGP